MSPSLGPSTRRSDQSGEDPDPPPARRERAAIAAQACDTCRLRKSKCDERRPKCGLCQRVGADCHYREPQPTKKDKTLMYILDSLVRVESKVDLIGKEVAPTSAAFESASPISPQSGPQERKPSSTEVDGANFPKAYVHVTTPHKVLLWPYISSQLSDFQINVEEDLQALMQEGTPWFLRQEMQKNPQILPSDVGLTPTRLESAPPTIGPRNSFLELTPEKMHHYATLYFNSFDVLYLLLDRTDFIERVLPYVARNGFGDGDCDSIVALMVFALGKLAIDGTYGTPLEISPGVESGLRGGSIERPPGLDIFNEARRRFGFVATQCSLENIQALLLSAVYYESAGRHLDFWRASQSASMACQVLIKCAPIDWYNHQGNLLKRVYWTCNLIENWYHFDLDLPRTGICEHEDEVPLSGALKADPSAGEQHTLMCFLATIALRRLVTRVHNTIFEGDTAESQKGYTGPPTSVIRELARQLESWRSMLPPELQWSEQPANARLVYAFEQQGGGDLPHDAFGQASFGNDGPIPDDYRFGLDLTVAQLRSRYYYAKFMIYRPFVFKALHFPELLTEEDRSLVALCINSALMWPIAMAPPKNRKRLVPYLFSWTQNFLGILLILRMVTLNDTLQAICLHRVDQAQFSLTVRALLDWIMDMKQIDGIADWSWQILRPLWREHFPNM
ncbi:hypothetical protein K490DRAFT_44350 [Saccharata proteae CBS 121410]|uniref:Zn(2)-C6 fungal-type domain-containing protein n=1 Tax=Saccharata proteae CBS 121410 TaxID=1314787 RepID=A0A9P4HVP1_9PEZI|nr:hypothetical protein K490DRAFT_44350 [Saccharata proteae CBS 121410]